MIAIFVKNKCPFELMHCNSTYPLKTEDINLRVKCDALGLEAEDYYKDYIEDIENREINYEKISLTDNTEKMWEVRNIVESLKECEKDDIVCRLDGDDWLCDLDALTIINYKYGMTHSLE